jgi:SSS family solute:Na+ symporter
MTSLDWLIVVALNGSIILYALWRGRETHSSSDWFLAGRTLPWWIVGLSMYATAIDSSDLVADSGGTYRLGMSYYVTGAVGTVAGWLLLARFIAPPMYRAGMYTNAEYLEARFGPAARVISALVQVQYRMLVLGIISVTIFLTLRVACDMDEQTAWVAVLGVALLATIYTMVGGLKSVAVTDAMQSVVMIVAAAVLFFTVLAAVGGWSGVGDRLARHDENLARRMLHVGEDRIEEQDVSDKTDEEITRALVLGGERSADGTKIVRRTPAWLVCTMFIIAGIAYAVVNHTQTMRLFGARSEWDMKMAVVVAGAVLIVATFFNLTMGVMGRSLYPMLADVPLDEELRKTADAIYPLLVREYTGAGLKGLVVAGILAACFSTYDSIGSTLSALLTRDVYARTMVPSRDDAHYLRVGRWLTPLVVFGSFVYVPFLLSEGMLFVYLDLVGAFVVPLLTIYLMGTFTRVHRAGGTVGMLVGVAYGVWRLVGVKLAAETGTVIIPPVISDGTAAYPISMAITAVTMLIVSIVWGWAPKGELLHEERSGWLRDSQQEIRRVAVDEVAADGRMPMVLGVAVLGIGGFVCFVVFW